MIPATFTDNLRRALTKARTRHATALQQNRSLAERLRLAEARADRADYNLRQFAGASAEAFMNEPLRLCVTVARFRSPDQQRLAVEQAIATLRRDALEALKTGR